MKSRKIFYYMLAISMLSSCAVIRPGEVGMVQTLGKLKTKPVLQGVRMYNPSTTKIVRVSTRINEVYSELIVPTKEGLSINAEVSLLYHILPDSAKNVYTLFG
jgi:prohibitin 1